jgi:predicted  nucleic acid-binding Zn-ribbon protein
MQYQLIIAMVVTLFLLFYREHKTSEKRIVDAFSDKTHRLEREITSLQQRIRKLSDNLEALDDRVNGLDTWLSSAFKEQVGVK